MRTLSQPSPVSPSRLARAATRRSWSGRRRLSCRRLFRGGSAAGPTRRRQGPAPPSPVDLPRLRRQPAALRRRSAQGRGGACRANLFASAQETPCAEARFAQIVILPNTHVPVVVCRSAGIWTRGQLTVLGRPAAGGEPANPAKRGTRLEATTDRAFLVSAGPPKVGAQRGLSFLPGVRTGHFLVQTMALIA
jgi:hypothetical protein